MPAQLVWAYSIVCVLTVLTMITIVISIHNNTEVRTAMVYNYTIIHVVNSQNA